MKSSLPENYQALVKLKSTEKSTDEKILVYEGITEWLTEKINEVKTDKKPFKFDTKDHAPKKH